MVSAILFISVFFPWLFSYSSYIPDNFIFLGIIIGSAIILCIILWIWGVVLILDPDQDFTKSDKGEE